jgi:hypothetical protein
VILPAISLVKYQQGSIFSCGDVRIDNYLKNNSGQDHSKYKLGIFTARLPSELVVIGFYSLTFIVWKNEGIPKANDGVQDNSSHLFGEIRRNVRLFLVEESARGS